MYMELSDYRKHSLKSISESENDKNFKTKYDTLRHFSVRRVRCPLHLISPCHICVLPLDPDGNLLLTLR